MPKMRVFEGDDLLAEFEADHVPSVGDTFWWQTAGPFRVIDRAWSFPAEYNDVAHRVSLTVERISALQ